MNRDNPIWNANELVDERSGAPRLDDDLLGVDWGDIGRGALGAGHLAGKVLLSAFGAGAAVQPLEQLEARGGALPQWAAKSLNDVKPDAVIIAKKDGTGFTIRNPDKAVVFGGTRFDGPGYVKGTLGAFSFGVDSPTRVDVTSNKRVLSYTDVQQVLFLGGIEGSETVMGGTMNKEQEMLALGAALDQELCGDDLDYLAQSQLPLSPTPVDYTKSRAYQTALARAQAAQARAAAAQAQQPLTVTPVTLAPITVPSLALNLDQGSFAMPTDETVSGVRDVFPLYDQEDVLGEEDDYRYEDPMDPAGDTEINMVLGSAYHEEGWAEIVGEDYFVGMTAAQRKKLLSYMNKIKKTILSGDRGEAELVGMTEAQRRQLKAYMDKIKKTILSGSAQYCAPKVEKLPDHVLGADVCGATAAMLSAQQPKTGLLSTLLPARQATAIAPLARKSSVPVSKRTVATPHGKKTFKVAGRSTNKSPHKLALGRATFAMNRALRAGTQAQNRAARYRPKAPTAVHGLDTVFGATALTPRQVAAVQRRDAMARRAAASAARADKLGATAIAIAKRVAAVAQKAKPVIDKLLKKSSVAPTRVHGFEFVLGHQEHDMLEHDLLGSMEHEILERSLVGAMPGDSNFDPRIDGPYGTDPTTGQQFSSPQPGYPSGGTADPNVDPNTGVPYTDPGSGPAPVDPSQYSNGSDIPMPTRGQPLSKDDASTVWQTVPDDGVIYQGQKGFPDLSVGSWSTYYGKDGTGRKNLSSLNIALPGGVDNEITPGFMWGVRSTEGTSGQGLGWVYRDEPADWPTLAATFKKQPEAQGQIQDYVAWHIPPASLADIKALAQNSINRGWGPLIGNPQGVLAGLQFAMSTGDWFWQSANAPTWATAEQDAQIALLNKQANDAAAAAAAADAARLQQEQAQQAEAQANQDAQNALAQSAADSQAAIAQQQLDQQQQIADSQAAAAQTALELQATKADLTYGQQQAALEQEAAKADLEYAIAHPELAIQEQQMADQQDQGAPDEGDLGDLSDTTDRGAGADQFDRSSELDLEQREGSAVTDDQFASITEGTTSTEENEAAAAAFDET